MGLIHQIEFLFIIISIFYGYADSQITHYSIFGDIDNTTITDWGVFAKKTVVCFIVLNVFILVIYIFLRMLFVFVVWLGEL